MISLPHKLSGYLAITTSVSERSEFAVPDFYLGGENMLGYPDSIQLPLL